MLLRLLDGQFHHESSFARCRHLGFTPLRDLPGKDSTDTLDRFSVPPPDSQGIRGLNVGYTKNADATLTVHVLRHET
jgi:hypothetical protein